MSWAKAVFPVARSDLKSQQAVNSPFGRALRWSLSSLSCSIWAQPDKSMSCKAEKMSSRLADERLHHRHSIWYCFSRRPKPASISMRSSWWSATESILKNSFQRRSGTSLMIAYRTMGGQCLLGSSCSPTWEKASNGKAIKWDVGKVQLWRSVCGAFHLQSVEPTKSNGQKH